MSDRKDIYSGFLKDKLGNYQVEPPEEVWDAISGHMSSGRKKRGFYILLAATAASVALAITLGLHFFSPDLPRQQSMNEEPPVNQRLSEPARIQDAQNPQPEARIVEEAESAADREIADAVEYLIDDESRVKEKSPADEVSLIDNISPAENVSPDNLIFPTDIIPSGDNEYADNAEVAQAPEPAGDSLFQILNDSAGDINTNSLPSLEQERKKESSWMVGAAISPLYSYRDAESVALSSNQAESGMLSYSTGIHVRYRRNSRLAFETGVYYNRTGISIGAPGIQIFSQRSDAMIFGVGSENADITTISNSVGNIVAYSGDIYMNNYKVNAENTANAMASEVLEKVDASESGIQQHLDFLELPFNLRYSVIDRTIELQLVGGLSTNFLVGNSVTTEGISGREEIGYLTNVNRVNYSGNAGLGLIYHMGKNLSLMMEPRFRYFLNSVNDRTLPSTRPYSLGFYTGLNYTF